MERRVGSFGGLLLARLFLGAAGPLIASLTGADGARTGAPSQQQDVPHSTL
jgi:hypothetical protein